MLRAENEDPDEAVGRVGSPVDFVCLILKSCLVTIFFHFTYFVAFHFSYFIHSFLCNVFYLQTEVDN